MWVANCMLTMTGTLNAATAANSYAGYSYLGFNIAQGLGGRLGRDGVWRRKAQD